MARDFPHCGPDLGCPLGRLDTMAGAAGGAGGPEALIEVAFDKATVHAKTPPLPCVFLYDHG